MPDNRKILWHIYETWLPWDYLNIIWTFYYNRYLLLINAPNSCNSRNINMCSNGNHILLLSSILNTLHVCIHCTTLSITTLYISVYQFLYKPDLDMFNWIFTRKSSIYKRRYTFIIHNYLVHVRSVMVFSTGWFI
jgi:hypothetical protein